MYETQSGWGLLRLPYDKDAVGGREAVYNEVRNFEKE